MKKTVNEIVKVIIIDDHRLFNDGLNSMLSSEPTVEILDQVYDSREAKGKIKKMNPDVILMDFNMPYLNGIDLTSLLLNENPELKILILSMYNEERHIQDFRDIGAKGYIFKTASPSEVVEAIHKVYAGGYYYPKVDKRSNHSDDQFLKKLKLSSREREVIQLIKEGLKTKEIAERLQISFYTAETHRKNIKLKVGLEGEADFLKFIFGK